MNSPSAQYISASRRTDIPRFFHSQFFSAWESGAITYDGGYGRSYTVSLRPEDVLGYIFWSKDYGPFVDDPRFSRLFRRNNAVFHFTLNDCPELEPGVAPITGRLATLERLCGEVGAERVLWRFDPICKFIDSSGRVQSNAAVFLRILPFLAEAGVKRCYFSFMSSYAKLKGRPMRFVRFSDAEKVTITKVMQKAGRSAGIALFNCCNTELGALLPDLALAHCVDDDLLRATDRFGVHPGLKKKPTREGCGCYASRDIGSYTPACPHGCLYCYANPALG